MIRRLHHIGLVVSNISEMAIIFEKLGLTLRTRLEHDPIQKVVASFVSVADGIYVELLEPVDAASPIINFLQKKGGGLHHLCFEVDDIEAVTACLCNKGFRMVCAPVECQGFDHSFPRLRGRPEVDALEQEIVGTMSKRLKINPKILWAEPGSLERSHYKGKVFEKTYTEKGGK
jgi:methylmalonyl-CoA/ethylmalonyl-CoA epimerase